MRYGLLVGVGSLAFLANAAQAQTATDPQNVPTPYAGGQDQPADTTLRTVETDDGTIVVTAPNYVSEGGMSANKTDIPLIATPQSVSLVTRDQIDLLDFVDAQQAVRYSAGVFGENYGPDARYDFFTVRSFTPKQYIDGLAAPISSSISSVGVDLYGFETLAVLKGPANTLYGNSPPGGIYDEVSRRAAGQFGGEVRAQYGTDQFAEFAGTVTGPVSSALDVRFTGLYRDRDLVADRTNTRRVFAAPTATLKLGASTTLTGLAYYQYDRGTGGNGGFLPVQGTLLRNPNGTIGQRTNLDDPRDVFMRRQFSVGYELVHHFSDTVSFTSNAKWNEYRERAPTGIYATGLAADLRTVQQSNFSYAEDVHSFATDNRLAATVSTGPVRHTLLIGIDYRNVLNVAAFGFVGAGTLDAFDPVYSTPDSATLPGYPFAFNDQRLKQTGLYAQDQAQLGDLYLTAGGRYDWVDSHYVPAAGAALDTDQHRFTYRLGANYVTTPGIAPYVSYATSFEPVLGTDSVTGTQFKPSTGRQWEGGVKYDARGLPGAVRLFATAAAFDIKQRNVVSTTPSVTPVSGTQSGEVEVYGAEFELVARIRNQFSVNAAYSYNHSKVLQSDVAAEIGQPLPTTPTHKASAFANYDFQRGALAGFGVGGGVRYTSSSAGSLPGPFNPIVYRGQAATLFDAILSYDIPGWRFAVNGSNVLDHRYVARCSGPVACFYGAPRQVLATVTKKF